MVRDDANATALFDDIKELLIIFNINGKRFIFLMEIIYYFAGLGRFLWLFILVNIGSSATATQGIFFCNCRNLGLLFNQHTERQLYIIAKLGNNNIVIRFQGSLIIVNLQIL